MKRFLLAALAAVAVASPALAQQVVPPALAVPGVSSNLQWRVERIGENHWKLIGDVEVEKDGVKVSADEMEIFTDKDLLTAKGNVTLTTLTERISAERLEFNTKTRLGTFFHASGSSRIDDNPKKPKNQFGAQETDVLFFGETIEKIGYRKYKVTKGGFTTCVQSNPRWMMTSSTVIVNVNHYAMLKNAVIKVKGIPVLYLPVVYYPINKEDRATGFLLPMYGTSSMRGTTLSNAFFWAFSRSQDATFLVDWFSKTGYGYGTEYRRVASEGASTNFRFYRLNEKPITYKSAGSGATISQTGRQSFQINASAIQPLPLGLKARASVNYFSSAVVQQTYNTDVLAATYNSTFAGGGINGNWGSYTLSGGIDRTETFYSSTYSVVNGSAPRLSFSRKERPIFGTNLYFSAGGDFASMIRQSVTKSAEGVSTITDSGLSRFSFAPRIRFPFTKIPFFTVNSSLSWNFARWNMSLDDTGTQVYTPITRNYFDMSARFVGPVFNRVWSTPGGRYAEKIKHTIEPWFNVQRLTYFENRAQIVKSDTFDYIMGGVTQIQFGLNNRFYAKRKVAGVTAQSRQILSVGVRQTYYTDSIASQYDPAYSSSLYAPVSKPQKMSPVALDATVSPTDSLSAMFRTEYNTYINTYLSFTAAGTYRIGDWFSTSAAWNKRNYGPGGIGLAAVNHYLSNDTTFRFKQNRVGGHVSFNWDLGNNKFLQRRFVGYYNAQCCGLIVEYQTFDYSGLVIGGYNPRLIKDHRWNFGITLAGIGTFSNIFGALSPSGR